jgi:transcription initiation factor TFIIIB Brf1 subunit/transcription initiation factor TFIIB
MDHDKIICVYCKKNAELIKSNNNTAVICANCGIAIELETYKELFNNRIYKVHEETDAG